VAFFQRNNVRAKNFRPLKKIKIMKTKLLKKIVVQTRFIASLPLRLIASQRAKNFSPLPAICIMLCAPVVLLAQNGVTVSNLVVDAGTVTFNVAWNRDAMPVALWSDTVWVFVDYNKAGRMERLLVIDATASAGTVEKIPGNDKGVWIIGNARTNGSFSATVQLLTTINVVGGACAYASNYPPVGEYISATNISFTGTPMYKIVLEETTGGTTFTAYSDGSYTLPAGHNIQSFTDATGAPGIMKCIPAVIHDLKVSAPSYCAGSSVTFALSNTSAGRIYQLYKGDDKVMNTLTMESGGGATFSGIFAGAGVYTAKAESDAVNCGAVMNGNHTISENPLPSITLASGNITQTVTQGDAITDIKYFTANATGATSSGLPDGVDGTWNANTYTIAGTPSTSGTFSYTVTPSHTNGCVASASATGNIYVYSPYPPGAGTVTYTAVGLVWSEAVHYDAPTCSKVNSITSNDQAEYAVADGKYYYTKACARQSSTICPDPWRLPTAAEAAARLGGDLSNLPLCVYDSKPFYCNAHVIITADCANTGLYDFSYPSCSLYYRAEATPVVCVKPL
jgi:hypothetical protein